MATIRRPRDRDLNKADRYSDFFVTANSHYVPKNRLDLRLKARELRELLNSMLDGGKRAPIFWMIGHNWPEVREIDLQSASVELGGGRRINRATGRAGRGPGRMLHLHFKISIRHRVYKSLGPAQQPTVDIGLGRRRRTRWRYGIEPGQFAVRMKQWFDANWPHTRGFKIHAPLSLSSAEHNYIQKEATSSVIEHLDVRERSADQATQDVIAGFDNFDINDV